MRLRVGAIAGIAAILLIGYCGCAGKPVAVDPASPEVRAPEPLSVQTGKATYYADKFQGRKTASGERYDRDELTAAHRKLPFGAVVRVVNLANKRKVLVRINDRGPFSRGRVIDVSRAAARKLDMIRAGVVKVRVEVLSLPE